MAKPLIFALSTPEDYDWSAQLVRRLQKDGYTVYLEPPTADTTSSDQTAQALYAADVMLVMVSSASALGTSAEMFEAWWRPFWTDKRAIVVCLVEGSPAGADYWMPFDLSTLPRADFSSEDNYDHLRLLLAEAAKHTAPPRPTTPPPAPITPPLMSRADPTARANMPPPAPQRPPRPSNLPKPPIQPSASAAIAIEQARQNRENRRLGRYIIGVPLIIGGLVVLWVLGLELANTYDSMTALMIVSSAAVLGTLASVLAMILKARRTPPAIIAEKLSESRIASRRRPDVYVEVIACTHDDELGRIFAITQLATTIGRANATITLHDRQLAKSHCTIFYERADGQYYLENHSPQATIMYDMPLSKGEVRPLENGDLIVLGEAVVLQFRTAY